jgi:uncharacterized protein (TIGR03435 family)
MKRTTRLILLIAAAAFAAMPLPSQTPAPQRLSFDVVSIKPNASPPRGGYIGGGTRGDRYTMVYSNLRMLLQGAYQRRSTTAISPLQIVGGPSWIDSDRYDIQATANCSGGSLSQEQVQLMVRSMLEDRFQLKAHMETREGQVYNLVVAKNPPKIKVSEDQTAVPRRVSGPILPCSPVPEPPANPGPPTVPPGQRGSPFDPDNPAPRGFLGMRFSQAGIMLRGSAVTISGMIGMLQNYVGGTIIDKTDLKGLYDFTLQFGPEGLVNPDGRPMSSLTAPGTPRTVDTAADPAPTLFSAVQELGLKLESAKGPIEVLVVESVQKPTEN